MRLMMVARRSVDRMETDGHGTPSYFHSNMRWRARAVGPNTIIVTPIRVTSQGVLSCEGKHHHCNTHQGNWVVLYDWDFTKGSKGFAL